MYFASDLNLKVVRRYLRRMNLIKQFKEETCTGRKTKIIFSGGKLRYILNSSEVFYGGDKKFTYTICKWIKAEAAKFR